MLLGVLALGVTAQGGLAAEPTIEVTGNSLATYAWTPSTAEVGGGGSVAFKNATANLHGLVWESGPETPSCTGTPSVGQANWSGSCTFAQGGTYKFYCPVHPTIMKGTVTVTGPAAPVVSTGSATAVSETEATLNGTVNPSEQETSYFFEYGPTAAYGQKTAPASAGSGTAPVPKSATVSGLSPATTYHFRLVAENAIGTTFGSDRTFSTTGPPSATTNPATAVSDVGATLNGTIDPNGFQTTYFFNYGRTTAYGLKTAPSAAGNGTGDSFVSAPLAGLSPETTYHFQLMAESPAGTTSGADMAFTTTAVPPVLPPATLTPPPSGSPSSPAPPAAAPAPADTRITLKPGSRTKDRTPTFKFTATVAGAAFRCSIDGKAFKACRSPYTTPSLKLGRHTFRVAAVAGGLADPTPAGWSFKVVARKR
ncbi:MAG TPA: plastocyanin/azurin family copper-binding protein [Solirubrobacterales bacterium]|nr:plastocyanin/azurin family copper-binding protein [Solirubrobacterales bacterium]